MRFQVAGHFVAFDNMCNCIYRETLFFGYPHGRSDFALHITMAGNKALFVHVLYKGKIVKSGTKDLALQLEEKGYDWIKEESIAEKI